MKCSNIVINITPHRDLSCRKCKKKFYHHKILVNFQIKSPHCNGREGEQKPCVIKLLSYLVRNNMETYYTCTWLSFVNQKNEKIRNWRNLIIKNISTVPKLLLFKNNLSVHCISFLWICRQLKHHQLRIRSEIFISLEIILNAFNVWQYHFPLKSLFWL